MADTRKTGSFRGQSNALGHGGRAAQLKAAGVPGGVIGAIARRKGAAPGGPNYHGGMAGGGTVTTTLPGMEKKPETRAVNQGTAHSDGIRGSFGRGG